MPCNKVKRPKACASERSESSRRTCTAEKHLIKMRTHHDLCVSCRSSILRILKNVRFGPSRTSQRVSLSAAVRGIADVRHANQERYGVDDGMQVDDHLAADPVDVVA